MQRLLSSICAQVRRTIELHDMVRRGDRVLVAVSGGSDSVGLLAILDRLRKRLRIELVAAHVNHALRGADSDLDEACAAAAAARLKTPFARASLARLLRPGANLEERAREMRYAALARLAAEHGCRAIATGHTRDDQAETVLLRLIRGSGPSGLAAIHPRRADGVVRPLLDCRRADVARVARATGLAYRHDRSNDDPRHLRTEVRHRVLPLLGSLNPAIVDALARTAALERDDAAVIDRWVEEHLAETSDSRSLDAGALAALPGALRSRVVRRWLAAHGIGARGLAARHLAAVLHLAIQGRAARSVVLPGRRHVYRRGPLLRLDVPEPARPASAQRLSPGEEVAWPGGWRLAAVLHEGRRRESLPRDLWTAACAADELALPLTVRAARRGERVRPLGLGGSRKLSDVFIDRHVPAAERASYPVVACGDAILWVPGLVRSESFAIGPRTRRSVWLRAVRTHDR